MEKTECPENKTTHKWTINLQQSNQSIKCRNNSLFNKWCSENWTSTWKRIKLYHYLIPYKKLTQNRLKIWM